MWRNWRKTEKIGLALLLVLAALVQLSLKGSYPSEPPPIYFAEGGPSRVALTFEILWSGENLDKILSILERESLQATFFITGIWLEKNAEVAKSILAGGHEIGNHTMSRRILIAMSQQEMTKEIKAFNTLCAEILEYRPRLFRPPLGLYNGQVLRTARQQGCRTVLWSVDSGDWVSQSSSEISRRVAERVHDGAILLFRVEAPHLPAALPEVLEIMRQQGYEPGSVGSLLENRERR